MSNIKKYLFMGILVILLFLTVKSAIAATTTIKEPEYRSGDDTLNKNIDFSSFNHTLSLEEHREGRGTYVTNEIDITVYSDNFPFYPNVIKAVFPEGTLKEQQMSYEYEYLHEDFIQQWNTDSKTITEWYFDWKSVNTTKIAEIKTAENSISYWAYRNVSIRNGTCSNECTEDKQWKIIGYEMKNTQINVPIVTPIIKNKGDKINLYLKAWLIKEGEQVKYNITIDVGEISKLLVLNKNIIVIDPFFNTTTQADFLGGTNNRTQYNATEAAQGINASDYLQGLPHDQKNESEWQYGVDGKVLRWLYHFNNDSTSGENATNPKDFSGSGRNGTWVGQGASQATSSNGTAKLGAFSGYFNGSSYVSIGTSTLGTNYCAGAWVYIFDTSTNRKFMAYTNSASGNYLQYMLDQDGTQAEFIVRDGSNNVAEANITSAFTVNNWYHVVGCRSDNSVFIYVNGVNGTSGNATPSNFGGFIVDSQSIGAFNNGGGANDFQSFFRGLIDEPFLMNKTLTAAEVKIIYDRQREQYIQQGEYVSQVFDAGTVVNWTNISWVQNAFGELPNNRMNESADSRYIDGVDMNGTFMLLHFNNETVVEDVDRVRDWTGLTPNGSWTGGGGGNSNGSAYLGTFSGYFDGDTYVDFPVNNNFTQRSYSVSVWINPKPNGRDSEIFGVHTAGSNGNSIAIRLCGKGQATCGADQIRFDHYGAPLDSNGKLTFDSWQHLAFVYDNTNKTKSIWINGQLDIREKRESFNGTNPDMWVGSTPHFAAFGDDHYNGTMDEFAVWNRSLRDDEIQNIYKRGALRLNLSMRSCDDTACSGDEFTDVSNDTSPRNGLSLPKNRYVQYRYLFTTNDTAFTPFLYNVSTGYFDDVVPVILFVEPTPSTGVSSSNTSFRINISATENNVSKFIWNWNGTNYTFYNDTLLIMYNFDNITAIGDNTTFFTDIANEFHGSCPSAACPTMTNAGAYSRAFTYDGYNDQINVKSPIVNASAASGYALEFRVQPQAGLSSGYLNLSGELCIFDAATVKICFSREGILETTVRGRYTPAGDGMNGNLWNDTGVFGASNSVPYALTVWNGSLYASTGVTGTPNNASIFRYDGLTTWTWIGQLDVQLGSGYVAIARTITVFNNTLFVGEDGGNAAGRVWKYDGGTTWTSLGETIAGGTGGTIYAMVVWNGSLYATSGGGSNDNGSVMRYTPSTSGSNWTYSGLGDTFSATTLSLGVWNDTMYAGVSNSHVMRYEGENSWMSLGKVDTSFSDKDISSFVVWNGTLYAGYDTLGFGNASIVKYNETSNSGGYNFSFIGQAGTTSSDTGFHSMATWNGSIYATTSGNTGKVYRFNGTGFENQTSTWNMTSFLSNDIRAIAEWNGTLFATTTVSSQAHVFKFWNGTTVRTTNKPLENRFYHVVVSRNTTSLGIYLDGVLNVTFGTGDYMPQFSDFIRIGQGWGGSWVGSSGNYFNGTIDEFRIWNRSLTADEISQYAVSNLNKYGIGNWTFYSNQTLTGGTYNYSGCVEDNGGNINCTESRTYTFTPSIADTSVPNVSIITPLNYSNFSLTTVVFNVSVNDSSQNISVIFQFSNGTGLYFNRTTQNLSGFYNFTLDTAIVTEGLQNMTVFANDSANNQNNTQKVFFTVDRTFPNITLLTPINDSNFSLSSSNQTFYINVSELNFVNLVLFSFDNASTGFNVTAVNNSGTWNISYNVSTLAEGFHEVTVFANDSSGNLNKTQKIYFTTDYTFPNITLRNPINDSNFSITSNEQNFSVSVAELNYVNLVLFSFDNATGNGFNLTGQNLSGFWNVTYNVSNLVEGFHEVTVFANDSSGNLNKTQKVYFTTDYTFPNVTWLTPTANTAFSRSSSNQTFAVNVTELNYVNLGLFSFDNISMGFNATAINNSGIWNLSYNVSTLGEGFHRVTAFMNDSSGNLNKTEFLRFTVDFTPPNVTNTTPLPNTVATQNGIVEISANITDTTYLSNITVNITLPNTTQIRIVLGNSTAQPSKFNASFSITNLAGNYNVTFFANDTANNINNTQMTNFTVVAAAEEEAAVVVSDGRRRVSLPLRNLTIVILTQKAFYEQNEEILVNIETYRYPFPFDAREISAEVSDGSIISLTRISKGNYSGTIALPSGEFNITVTTKAPDDNAMKQIKVFKYPKLQNFIEETSKTFNKGELGFGLAVAILSVLTLVIIIEIARKKR